MLFTSHTGEVFELKTEELPSSCTLSPHYNGDTLSLTYGTPMNQFRSSLCECSSSIYSSSWMDSSHDVPGSEKLSLAIEALSMTETSHNVPGPYDGGDASPADYHLKHGHNDTSICDATPTITGSPLITVTSTEDVLNVNLPAAAAGGIVPPRTPAISEGQSSSQNAAQQEDQSNELPLRMAYNEYGELVDVETIRSPLTNSNDLSVTQILRLIRKAYHHDVSIDPNQSLNSFSVSDVRIWATSVGILWFFWGFFFSH